MEHYLIDYSINQIWMDSWEIVVAYRSKTGTDSDVVKHATANGSVANIHGMC